MQKLNASQLQAADYARMVWVVTPEEGTPFETILSPLYWAHVSKSFKPWHMIEVRCPEFSYFAELIVRDCGAQWAKVEVLRKVDLRAVQPKAAAPVADGYEVKHRGRAGWCVVRSVDKAILLEGATSRDAATDWLNEHLKKIAA